MPAVFNLFDFLARRPLLFFFFNIISFLSWKGKKGRERYRFPPFLPALTIEKKKRHLSYITERQSLKTTTHNCLLGPDPGYTKSPPLRLWLDLPFFLLSYLIRTAVWYSANFFLYCRCPGFAIWLYSYSKDYLDRWPSIHSLLNISRLALFSISSKHKASAYPLYQSTSVCSLLFRTNMVSTGFTTEVTITTTNTQPSPSSSWLSSISAIMCAPLASCFGRKPRRSKSPPLTATSISWPLGRTSDQDLLIGPDEKQLPTTRTQPAREALPVARQGSGTQRPATSERVPRKSFGSMRSGAPGKKRWRSDGSRRPKISKPTDFRHLETGSFHFPPPEPQPQPQSQPLPSQLRSAHPERSTSFRPLELSIYLHNNRMSPLLPQFDIPSTLPPPEPTHLRHRLDDDHKLFHQKSHQSIPFHIPRKAVGSINSDANEDNAPNAPAIPPKAQGRARAYTSPEVDAIKDRVADAMNEIERLQKKIDDVIERQSVYSSSRPSTSHSMAHTTLGESRHPIHHGRI